MSQFDHESTKGVDLEDGEVDEEVLEDAVTETVKLGETPEDLDAD